MQRGANGKARLGSGVRDQIHDDLVAGERIPTPAFGNKAEEPMFNLVPLAGALGGCRSAIEEFVGFSGGSADEGGAGAAF